MIGLCLKVVTHAATQKFVARPFNQTREKPGDRIQVESRVGNIVVIVGYRGWRRLMRNVRR